MKMKSLFLICLLISFQSSAQKYFNYSDDTLEINSKAIGKKFTVNLHLPETLGYASEKATYPITFIFDSQHESTYPHIINSIDMLTSESQVPESIIVGIPFDMFNRFYLTSSKINEGDTLMGIEKMERFVFDELAPLLQKKYQANNFIQIIGHSRTGFLVNYLITKRSEEINVAIALSGFYRNKPLTVDGFKNYISKDSNFPHPFKYYYTAGNTLEEEIYLEDCTIMNDYISKGNKAKNVVANYSVTSNANHMTNLWVSIPPILIDAYSDYNQLLNNWFHNEEKKKQIQDPTKELKNDLKMISDQIGMTVNPGLTQLFSIASGYTSTKEDLPKAIELIEFGLSFYPNYLDLNLTLLDYVKRLEDDEKYATYKNRFIQQTKKRADISEEKKLEIIKTIE